MAKPKTTPVGAAEAEPGVPAPPNGNGTHPHHVPGEDQEVVSTTTTRVRAARPRRAAAPAEARDPALVELEMFAASHEGAAAEMTVEREGPREYCGRPVQTGYCGRLPGGTTGIVEAVRNRWNGGDYLVRWKKVDGTWGAVRLPRIPGRPAPISAEEERDTAEAEAARYGFGERVGGAAGGFGGSYGGGSLDAIGWAYVAIEQRWVWTGPGAHPTTPPPPLPHAPNLVGTDPKLEARLLALERENGDLTKRLEQQKVDERYAKLEAKIDALATAKRPQDDDLAWKRENAANEQRAIREEALRREENTSRERIFALMQGAGRDKEALWEKILAVSNPIKTAEAMASLLGQRDPFASMTQLVGAAAQLQQLGGGVTSPAREIATVIGASKEALVDAVRELRQGAVPQLGTANPPADGAQSESRDKDLAGALNYALNAFRGGADPYPVACGLAGYCTGKSVDKREVAATLLKLTPERLVAVLSENERQATGENDRAFFRECIARLKSPEGAEWFRAFVGHVQEL